MQATTPTHTAVLPKKELRFIPKRLFNSNTKALRPAVKPSELTFFLDYSPLCQRHNFLVAHDDMVKHPHIDRAES